MKLLLAIIFFSLALFALGFGMCHSAKVRKVNHKLADGPHCIPGKNCPDSPTLPPA